MQQEENDLLQMLYEEYQKGLRLIAFRQGLPEHEVDDVIQDTFFAFMHTYSGEFLEWKPGRRKGTLVKILKNLCIDYHREQKRHKSVSMDSQDILVEYEIMKHRLANDVCDNLLRDEEMRAIRECIENMKPILREVAVLHMVQGRPIEEVCGILKISNAACRMRIFRIRQYMKAQFGKMG